MTEKKKKYSQEELDDIFKRLEEISPEELVKREREKSEKNKKSDGEKS